MRRVPRGEDPRQDLDIATLRGGRNHQLHIAQISIGKTQRSRDSAAEEGMAISAVIWKMKRAYAGIAHRSLLPQRLIAELVHLVRVAGSPSVVVRGNRRSPRV